MAKESIQEILTSPDKGASRISGINGLLSWMFRTMLGDLNICGKVWGQLMASFLTDARNGVPNNKRDQTSIRGNLTKEFSRTKMTWKVFCKAMRFLQVVELEITFKATRRNGVTMEHKGGISFGGSPTNEFLDEDEEAFMEEGEEIETEE